MAFVMPARRYHDEDYLYHGTSARYFTDCSYSSESSELKRWLRELAHIIREGRS